MGVRYLPSVAYQVRPVVIQESQTESEQSPVLEIEGFNLWYGAKQALHGISMPIPHGKVTALVGPNGGVFAVYLIPAEGSGLEPVDARVDGVPADIEFFPWSGSLADPEMSEGEKPRQRNRNTGVRGFAARPYGFASALR